MRLSLVAMKPKTNPNLRFVGAQTEVLALAEQDELRAARRREAAEAARAEAALGASGLAGLAALLREGVSGPDGTTLRWAIGLAGSQALRPEECRPGPRGRAAGAARALGQLPWRSLAGEAV